jgi:hypothetical protein
MGARTAVPWILLTRKRSQVQTLSRPPPFLQVTALPASSWSRSLPGWAALGPRAVLAAELVWSLPSPSIRTSGSATTTQRSRGSRPRWPPRTVPCGNLAPATPLPERSRQRQVPLAAVWPARSVGCSLPPKHHPAQVRSRRSPADLHTTCAAVPASMLLEPSTEPPGDGPTTWHSTGSRRDHCPPYRGLPHRHHPADAGRDGCDRADRQIPDGWTPDGLDTSRPDTRVRTREPDNRTLDGLDTGRLDTWTRTAGRVGWTPSSGHRLAMDSRQASWHPDHCTRTLPLGCCQKLRRADAAWADPQSGQLSRRRSRRELATAAPDSCQTAVGDPPPSGRRHGALLSFRDCDGAAGGQWDKGEWDESG